MKRILLVMLTLFLLGSSAGAVTFNEAMQKTAPTGDLPTQGLFPSWRLDDVSKTNPDALPIVAGVVGTNQDGKGIFSESLLMNYIPRLINILLKFVAPLVMASMVYAGIRFVYAGSNEEELSQAKQIFTYTLMGAIFVVLSYSIMKALYFLLSA